MEITVRRAVPGDAAQVARVYVDAWNAGFGTRMPTQVVDDAQIARWRIDLAAPRTLWWVATAGAEIVGLAGVGPSRDPVDPRVGELDTIGVAPAWWRHGVGGALMAVAHAALDTWPVAILWTLADYPPAQRFYAAHGWTPDGATRADGTQIRLTRTVPSPPTPPPQPGSSR